MDCSLPSSSIHGIFQATVPEWGAIAFSHYQPRQHIKKQRHYFVDKGPSSQGYGFSCGHEGNGTPLQHSCLENPMDGEAWWAAVHGVAKSQTRLNDFTFTFHFHSLEKEMATRSSVLAWRIPWTEKPGRLQSMGSHRVGHDWSDLAAVAVIIFLPSYALLRLFWWLSGKESDAGSTPGLGRSLGEGNGNPLQYSCLENPMDRGAWRAIVHRVDRSQIQLSD